MSASSRFTLPALLLFLPAAGALTPERPDGKHPRVPGYDRFPGSTAAERIESGRLLLGELNCVACHRAGGESAKSISPKEAPILSDVGARVRPEWIARWLAAPHDVKPGTSMPHVLAGKEKDAVPLMHYLMSLRGKAPLPQWTGAPKKGKELYHRVGCVACHAPLGAGDAVAGDAAVVPLGRLDEKYASASALARFIENPHQWRPSGRMPRLNLKRDEAVAIATHIVGVHRDPRDPEAPRETRPGLVYEYFEGDWRKVPDFDALKPVATGTTTKIGYEHRKRNDRMGFRFHGYLDIKEDGLYTFITNSDDGSALTIGDLRVVDNDGIHGGTEVSGAIFLRKGKHAFKVECFEQGGGEHCHVHYEGPGIKKRLLPADALSHHPSREYVFKATPVAGGFAPDPALVEKGRKLFVARRCAACHEVPDRAPAPAAAPLASLGKAGEKGCLSAAPGGDAANYGLSGDQREALRVALSALDSPDRPTPAQRVHRTLARLNCYACHERRKKGGPETGRLPYFTSTEPTVGDEGRIPPRLDDVGAKLTPHALREVLTKGTKVRPYMRTRMPVFGDKQVEPLVEDFARTEKLVQIRSAEPVPEQVTNGRLLVGSKGLNCVTCHVWNKMKTSGIQAMDLVHMPRRLRRDWFNRYMVNPMGLRPGTRMPTYWPEGRGVLKEPYGGSPGRQLEAIWQYLSGGGKARRPKGIGPPEILLEPKTEALVYRNFIQGVTPRGIGVGYPEGAHLAFDVNGMRIALLWQGDFIDASRHWVGRGSGFQPPAGDKLLKLHAGPPFAVLKELAAAWPAETGRKAGYDFGGYHLDAKRRPTFFYSFPGVGVKDFPEAVAEKPHPSIKRTLTLEADGPPAGLWYRAAAGKSIESRDAGYVVDGLLTVRLKTSAAPVIRKTGGGFELLVPVKFAGGKATIIQHYRW